MTSGSLTLRPILEFGLGSSGRANCSMWLIDYNSVLAKSTTWPLCIASTWRHQCLCTSFCQCASNCSRTSTSPIPNSSCPAENCCLLRIGTEWPQRWQMSLFERRGLASAFWPSQPYKRESWCFCCLSQIDLSYNNWKNC